MIILKQDRKQKLGRIIQFMLIFMLAVAACPLRAEAKAASSTQTAKLRIISTTDLHGQVSTMHYDTASDKPGSLAQAYTLIKQARTEVGTRNTLMIDTGDSVYGYAADYILNNSGEDTVQPIYKAMSLVNYDAITLGNHDFDYGYSYIDKQLELSGLKSKCVLSNIILAETGETAWNERMVVTKKLKTNKNKSVNVDIGLIGVTIPAMSTYSDCKEDLIPLPIVDTVEEQAAALEAQGVDLIVVIAHSSFGTANPESMSNNAVYALTKLSNVDAVVAGHGHKNYPSADEASATYYNLPNVDKSTGLMNGKPVTMIKDHGSGIGLIDLDLKIASDGKVEITKSAAGLRMVTKDTASSSAILASQASDVKAVDESLEDVIGTLAGNEKINSYFALLEDNYAIQLANEAKLQYGLAYTGGAGKRQYGDWPVVATTRYTLCNSRSADDSISLDGTIQMKDILNMQQDNHNNNILYWVTGAQLRELLEWSASIYAPMDGSISSDDVLRNLLKSRGASSIAASDWLDDWSVFAVFDGIEYTIDATRNPRYTKSGMLNDESSHRIVSMTHNGIPIEDDQKLILVSHTVTTNIDATGTISEQKVLGKSDLAYQQLIKYIKQQLEFGELASDTDHNWNVVFDGSREYIVRSSAFSQPDAQTKNWFNGLLSSNETFAYYLAKFIQAEEGDKNYPLLIVSSTQQKETDQPVEVKVQANDRSGIQQLKWMEGLVEADSTAWTEAQPVSRGSFVVEKNGTYSVMAEDLFGNRIAKHISINNIDPQIVMAPTLNKMSNKGSIVSGTAPYGTTVHIDADGATYEVETMEDGTFECTVERMAAGKTVSAYCMDENKKQSRTVSITVFKNGPDVPVVKEITNKTDKVIGYFTDTSTALVVVVGQDVYCSEEVKPIYLKSEAYSKLRTVHIVDVALSRNNFEFALPPQRAGETVRFMALDKAGRKSANVNLETIEVAPDVPVVQEVCNAETFIYGKVTNICSSAAITVTAAGEQFVGEVREDGSFEVKTNGYTAGDVVSVTASDVKDGTPRTSLAAEVTVAPFTDYTEQAEVRLQKIYNNSLEIVGDTTLSTHSVNLLVQGVHNRLTPDSTGRFSYKLDQPLSAGEYVYVVVRDGSRIIGAAVQRVEEYAAPSVPETPTEPGTPGETPDEPGTPTEPDASSVPQMPSVITSDINLHTQQILVFAKENGTIIMDVAGVEYTSQNGVYNQAYDGYIYTLQLPAAQQEQTISIRFVNAAGISSNSVTVMRTKNE